MFVGTHQDMYTAIYVCYFFIIVAVVVCLADASIAEKMILKSIPLLCCNLSDSYCLVVIV